jgi:hypothetical protein
MSGGIVYGISALDVFQICEHSCIRHDTHVASPKKQVKVILSSLERAFLDLSLNDQTQVKRQDASEHSSSSK